MSSKFGGEVNREAVRKMVDMKHPKTRYDEAWDFAKDHEEGIYRGAHVRADFAGFVVGCDHATDKISPGFPYRTLDQLWADFQEIFK